MSGNLKTNLVQKNVAAQELIQSSAMETREVVLNTKTSGEFRDLEQESFADEIFSSAEKSGPHSKFQQTIPSAAAERYAPLQFPFLHQN